MKPTRVAVVGCGLIGGSLALALAASDDHEVVAVHDSDSASAEAAVAAGAASRAASSVADAARDADVVVVGVDVSRIAETVCAALDASGPQTVVTDVGSVKGPVVAAVESARPDSAARYCGGHPMAGSERHGFEAADSGLFRNAIWVLTPTPTTVDAAITCATRLASAAGAAPLALAPHVHDDTVAVVSHVPHVAAAALMNVAQSRAGDAPVLRLAAGGFRDVTRIAAGSPRVWEDILAENSAAIRDALDAYIDGLTAIRADLHDRAALRATLESASRSRRALPIPEVAADLVSLVVPISDRPGAFAEIANALGAVGVNIVDVELRHSAEGGRGLLQVTLAAEAATAAVTALADRGFTAHTEDEQW
ncbi:MAG: prephenate dehydrogenase/arogenate dehydrogenase family protein [Acidimicrobiia bacterium]|nr:prephenate dehydrogenase/arogenate dehydrogenase family protein [Acidimicrobiia bacterium]